MGILKLQMVNISIYILWFHWLINLGECCHYGFITVNCITYPKSYLTLFNNSVGVNYKYYKWHCIIYCFIWFEQKDFYMVKINWKRLYLFSYWLGKYFLCIRWVYSERFASFPRSSLSCDFIGLDLMKYTGQETIVIHMFSLFHDIM